MDSYGSLPVKTGEITMPIAIVGMGCRFPGDATSPEKPWKLYAEAKSAWSEVPSERFNQKAFYHPQAEKLGTVSLSFTPSAHTHINHFQSNFAGAHFLSEDVGLFDASFFNFTSEVATVGQTHHPSEQVYVKCARPWIRNSASSWRQSSRPSKMVCFKHFLPSNLLTKTSGNAIRTDSWFRHICVRRRLPQRSP